MTASGLDCLLVGNESLLVQCGERLRAAGVRVVLVVSEDATIRRWAAAHDLPCVAFAAEVPVRLGPGAVDYVFSVGNLRVLSAAWLATARRRVINFHDALLPDYRGLHATSWALLHGEVEHGVTWHVAEPAVDSGAVLQQERFAIEPDDTAFTLNAKCYEAGDRAFGRLVAALGHESPVTAPPAGAAGRYFGRRRRPAAAGHVDWSRPLDECDALVRALDFGPYANPLCTPWSLREGRVVRVDRDTVARARSGAAPAFDPLPPELGRRIGEQHERWALEEPAWVERVRTLDPLRLVQPPAATAARAVAAFALPAGQPADPMAVAAQFVVWLARACDQPMFDLGLRGPTLDAELAGLEPWFETLPPARLSVDFDRPFADEVRRVAGALSAQDQDGTCLRDLGARYPELRGAGPSSLAARVQIAVTVGDGAASARDDEAALLVHVASDGTRCEWRYDAARLPVPVDVLQRRCTVFLEAAWAAPNTPVGQVPVVDAAERERLVVTWNDTATPIADAPHVADQFEAQAARTPDAPAVATWRERTTYRELNRRANRLAHLLRRRGIGRGHLVGVYLERSVDMVVALLAVLKSGAAYVPLDPAYPPARTQHTLADAGTTVVLTHAAAASRLPAGVVGLEVDGVAGELAAAAEDDPPRDGRADDLAYVIYTSGSTGGPKGVMVEHGNLTSFFAAMDARIDHDPPGVWLAVTSLSFDIAGLELLWTLCRGFSVVVHGGPRASATATLAAGPPIDLSLFYFASDESGGGGERYRLLLDGAVFADRHGFAAVWTPERHFHAFGGLYPNPAITSAAIAALTSRIRIRAGSLVLPLHHPVRAAEDWALVDNLSNGRVDVAFASGWHPNDFVLAPQHHAAAKQVMFDGLETMRRLWRGEAVTLAGPGGREVAVRTLPRPVQPELPFWITTAGNPETFRQAGALGANVLTHLLGQTIDEVAAKIRAYREARRVAGHAGPGHVTLMLHTFVGESDAAVRELVRGPMKQYLGSSLNLVRQHAWSFPAFKGRAATPTADTEALFRDLSPEDLDALLEHSFDRYFDTGGLFGAVDTCVATVERLRGIGVDEIACLIDFGVPADRVLASLERLAAVRRRVAPAAPAGTAEPAVPAVLAAERVTHFQCTPSMAAMLADDAGATAALAGVRHWLVGGEALPVPLARRLHAVVPRARLTNMYGPTETTIWSLSHDVSGDESPVPIGRPIANTRAYVVDARGELVPPGADGELWIGGPGVARGYHRRPELTAERFVADRFGPPGARLYRTGDRVRYRDDGALEFLGRLDQQVKVRGHRIELGEIEEALGRVAGVREAAVVAREVGGDLRLIGFVTGSGAAAPSGDDCRAALRLALPEVMVPSTVVVLDQLPLTPNGKIDRRALAARELAAARPAGPPAAPQDDLQRHVADLWAEVLHVDAVGIDDNFFDLGGHSLLVAQIASRLGATLGRALPITDLFRFPTVRGLARHLAGASGPAPRGAIQIGDDRAAARRAARPLQRRGGGGGAAR